MILLRGKRWLVVSDQSLNAFVLHNIKVITPGIQIHTNLKNGRFSYSIFSKLIKEDKELLKMETNLFGTNR